MDPAMLEASQAAAVAAQSTAQATWWVVLVNSAVVVVAIGTTFLQEWRVNRRANAAERTLHKGAVDTVRQGWIAMDEACELFYPAGEVDKDRVRNTLRKVERTRRLIGLFVAREVEPNILLGLLQMDDHLTEATTLLSRALDAPRGTENAEFNGELNRAAHSAQLLFISLA